MLCRSTGTAYTIFSSDLTNLKVKMCFCPHYAAQSAVTNPMCDKPRALVVHCIVHETLMSTHQLQNREKYLLLVN